MTLEEQEVVTAAPTTEPADTTAAASETAHPEQQEALQGADGLTVKFNKQEYQLSKEEAVNFAQMGMKYQAVEPLLSKLKAAAAQQGHRLSDYVEALCGQPEDINQRLAREFCALQEDCPDLERFDQLPEAVVQQAVDGTPLNLAYLRYCYGEHTRIRRAQATAQAAAAASAGTQRGEPQGIPDAAVEAMLRGVWN